MNKFALLSLVVLLSACQAATPHKPVTQKGPETLTLTPTAFGDLPSWGTDDMKDFATAYKKSCARILKKDSQSLFGKDPRYGRAQEWQVLCRKFLKMNQTHSQSIRSFFEQHFIPHTASFGRKRHGLFTGYYEAGLNGSRTKKGPYQYPLRARPDDLVMVDLGSFRDELKGQRIAGRVQSGRLQPYEDHKQILMGGLPTDQDKPLVWVDSAIDAFFIQIQGSGVVSLDDGTTMRVGYAGQNGHPYYAVGRELVKNGELRKDEVSLQTIRAWMKNNPSKATDLMTTNKSYVFFKELDGEGPVGGEGIALTPLRSLAVDHTLIAYGTPIWLTTTHPDSSKGPINRLMMAQDTGGAIRGAVRGDVFWGYGSEAEHHAGKMKSQGRYWLLLPKNL